MGFSKLSWGCLRAVCAAVWGAVCGAVVGAIWGVIWVDDWDTINHRLGGGRRPPPQFIYPTLPQMASHNSPADRPPDSRADSPKTAN